MLPRRINHSPVLPNECPLSECLSVIGRLWIPNIIWSLSNQSRRFTELKFDLNGISAKVLTERLKKLEADGVVIRQILPTSPPSVEYSLSPLGLEFLPIIQSILDVSHRLKVLREEEEKEKEK